MSEFKAEFYENGDEIPVKEFLDSLDDKMRAKFSMEIKLLEEKDTAKWNWKSEKVQKRLYRKEWWIIWNSMIIYRNS